MKQAQIKGRTGIKNNNKRIKDQNYENKMQTKEINEKQTYKIIT